MKTTTEGLNELLASCRVNENNTIDDDKSTKQVHKDPTDIDTLVKELKQQIKQLKTTQQTV